MDVGLGNAAQAGQSSLRDFSASHTVAKVCNEPALEPHKVHFVIEPHLFLVEIGQYYDFLFLIIFLFEFKFELFLSSST